ncbi:MAG TPA: ATP-binding cassette domain-containing protein [Desulfobaccales bacterium]|nr:ATP-binding cassette domain-containing protein [Desulfobaccales bacterium]
MAAPGQESPSPDGKIIAVENLVLGYGEHVVLDGVSFTVRQGEILSILGPSGCGKSTLLKALAGLITPMQGRIRMVGKEITAENPEEALERVRRHIGVLFQSGALFESLTVAENVALPLEEFTDLPRELIDTIVQLKLDLVDLGGFANLMPGELSGGMRKRAGLARTMALDPQILLCDEPASGLDPVIAREVDELLLELNQALGITLVVVTHSLASVHNLSGHCLMLDTKTKGIIAAGPLEDLKRSKNPEVRDFFHRYIGEESNEEEE